MAVDSTWDYTAGSLSGAGTVTKVGKCYGLSVVNASSVANASFKINSGDTITLRPGGIKDVNPRGKLFNATVTWVSGSIDVLIEILR